MTELAANAFVHDPRHRYSYELRPDAELDGSVRRIAARLEAAGLLEPGASTAARFQPHLTLCRASVVLPDAVDAAAELLRTHGCDVELADVGVFGAGRIIWLAPVDRASLDVVRKAVFARLDPETLDPFATSRPWVPHVTVAYAVPDHAQERALEHVRSALPLAGRWQVAQAWDLDVRPTQLVHARRCVPDVQAG